MTRKIKKLFTNMKMIVLLIVILFALVAIHPNPWNTGVNVRNVVSNSTANLVGLENPKPGTQPMSKEKIQTINNKPILKLQDYYDQAEKFEPNLTIHLKTTKATYLIIPKEKVIFTKLNETELINVTTEVFDDELNKTTNVTKLINISKVDINHTGLVEDIGLRVYDSPKTNIRKGLDLQGGTRILLQPEQKLQQYDLDTLIDNMKERLNVYGLSDVLIKEASDLSGNQYILVEIAGATEEEVKDLLAKQGKFEAKIGNNSVFIGGNDITYVCRSADCAGIDPVQGCGLSGGQWMCRFRFAITLQKDAADRQAEATKDLDIITEGKEQYLSEKLLLYLDDKLVDELSIGSDLKGQAVTNIQISGSGAGVSEQDAALTALNNMKRLQTILITGSLPVKLDIVKMDAVSPALGDEFVKNALIVAVLAIIVVAIVIFIRYRKVQIVLPILFCLSSEVLILLGFAAIFRWNLDLAAIAGMIIVVGTGVDHLIVITDETLRKEATKIYDWKKRIKSAFYIIMGSYLTTTVAMMWLWIAGAGLLKGFAFTTIAGASIGVFIVRPAYATIIEILLND
ncbi:MAG: hypothetical protein ABIC04_08525 [Nanoarchaeota archaeon]